MLSDFIQWFDALSPFWQWTIVIFVFFGLVK